jgi:hypothetical protein
MLIADRVLMLALSAEGGLPLAGLKKDRLQRGLVAALVAELALLRRLHLDQDGRIQVSDHLPLSHPLLAEVMLLLAQLGPAMAAAEVMAVAAQRLGNLWRRLAEGLFRRDLLHSSIGWRFGFWPQRVYRLRSRQARNECIELLRPTDPDSPSVATRRMLLALTGAIGVLDLLDPTERPDDAPLRAYRVIHAAEPESIRDPLRQLTRELTRFVRG